MKLCSLFSGSSGNAVFVEGAGTRWLVDAGLPLRTIERALASIGQRAADLTGVLLTHEHSDHVRGVGVLMRRHRIPVYANAGTWAAVLASPSLGRLDPDLVRVLPTGAILSVAGPLRLDSPSGDMVIRSFPTPHDAREPVGYRFSSEGRSAAVVTDIGRAEPALLEEVAGCDAVLIESNHDVEMLRTGPYPWPLKKRILGHRGHLSNLDCGSAVCTLLDRGTRCFLLGHLSHENNDPELAYETVRDALMRHGAEPGVDVRLAVALRDRPSDVLDF